MLLIIEENRPRGFFRICTPPAALLEVSGVTPRQRAAAPSRPKPRASGSHRPLPPGSHRWAPGRREPPGPPRPAAQEPATAANGPPSSAPPARGRRATPPPRRRGQGRSRPTAHVTSFRRRGRAGATHPPDPPGPTDTCRGIARRTRKAVPVSREGRPGKPALPCAPFRLQERGETRRARAFSP